MVHLWYYGVIFWRNQGGNALSRPIERLLEDKQGSNPLNDILNGEYDDYLVEDDLTPLPKVKAPPIETKCPTCGYDMGFDIEPRHMTPYHLSVMLRHMQREDVIFKMASEKTGTSFTEINSKLNIPKATLSDTMKRLVERGILRRSRAVNGRYYKA